MEAYAQDLSDDQLFCVLDQAKQGQIRLGFTFEVIQELDDRMSGKIRGAC